MDMTSQTMLSRLRDKSHQDEWCRFVGIYTPFILRFIRLDATMAADAEDICQEVLGKVAQHLPHFQRQRDGSFRAWLRTLTANEVNLFWRKRHNQQKAGRADYQPLAEALANPRNELSQAWDREYDHYLLCRLQAIVEPEFSPLTWRAFTLRVLEDKTSAEVAIELGISRNAVDIAKSRVLSRLRQEASGLLDLNS